METELSQQIIDTNGEKFLIFFKPPSVNTNICSIKIETTLKLISFLFLGCFIFHFIYLFSSEKVFTIIVSTLLCTGYIVCCVYLYISAVNFNYKYARIAYFILEAIVIFKSILAILYFVLILFAILPNYYEFTLKQRFWRAFGFFVLTVIDIAILVFFLWIIFTFMIMLKDKNKDNNLVGDYSEIPGEKEILEDKIKVNENKEDI